MAGKPIKRSDMTSDPMPDWTQIVRYVCHGVPFKHASGMILQEEPHEFQCLASEVAWMMEEALTDVVVIELYTHDGPEPVYLPVSSETYWAFLEMWDDYRETNKLGPS